MERGGRVGWKECRCIGMCVVDEDIGNGLVLKEMLCCC